MDPDDAAPPTTRRPSTAHDRPTRAPFGPRIRTKTKHSADMADAPTSPLSSSSSARSLAHTPFPVQPPTPPHADAAPSPPTLPPKPTTTPHKSAPTTFIAPPPLTPPPTVAFESTPIPWKGLPFDVAQWTFSSSELQEIVSKAIRLSARDSFVRLLSLQALEVDVVQEAERLDTERATAQAKWRFEVGRRTMLMQALNSTAASSAPNEAESENLVACFISQLAASIASCDSLLSSILQHSDQQAQIALIQHQHWASALGIALRKLNKAFERQGQELRRAQARVQTLEDELEEAWREAEKIALEFDELEQEVATSEGGSEDVDERPEEDTEPDADVQGHHTHSGPGLQVMQDIDETGTLGDITINTDIAVVLGVTATAVASKATLVNSSGSPRPIDKSDTKSIRSVKSTRSRRSTRDGPSHIARLSSARTRSRTVSNASLRLPKALRSTPSTHTSPVDAPPIPALPPSTVQGQSFLDMGAIVHEHVRKGLPPPRHPEPKVALPTPPHSAGLPPSRAPSIWLETDGAQSTRLNGLDRTHSLQIFSSLTGRTPKKSRRSNLVMSLTGSDRGSDSATGSPVEGRGAASTGSGSSAGMDAGAGTASPTSILNGSPVSLPTHARPHFHFHGPSVSSSSNTSAGVGAGRPGSAGARLTTTMDTRTPVPVATPRRSLVSRASSVILRRLSQATIGNSRTGGGGSKGLSSPSRSREALRLSGSGHALVERWREGEEEGQGEVMLIGSPHAESFDGP